MISLFHFLMLLINYLAKESSGIFSKDLLHPIFLNFEQILEVFLLRFSLHASFCNSSTAFIAPSRSPFISPSPCNLSSLVFDFLVNMETYEWH